MKAQENQNSALWFVDSHINKRENKLAFVEIDANLGSGNNPLLLINK